jgi:hypothetical protein
MPSQSAHVHRILLVGWRHDLREPLDLLLQVSGIGADLADSDDDALARIAAKRPCLVLVYVNHHLERGAGFRRAMQAAGFDDLATIFVTSDRYLPSLPAELGVEAVFHLYDVQRIAATITWHCGSPLTCD